nr:RNA-directed DNA polymerase, eukaryota, reverse transcriptase zinc-binding domain protein [Tanacetum cinerariifolium]
MVNSIKNGDQPLPYVTQVSIAGTTSTEQPPLKTNPCVSWDDTILKVRARLSKWKVKTLSIGGRLTLLKSVLGASPIYNMSIFKVPRGVLKIIESIRSRFFNGANQGDKKITWVAWDKALASKKHGGLGVSSYFALNRALLLKWVWRFLSQDGSLWCQIIRTLYGPAIRDQPLYTKYPRFFALELNKEVSMEGLISLLDSVSLSTSCERWFCDLTGDGEFRVKEVRKFIDDLFLPSLSDPTRWVRSIPFKVNIFTWRARLDCLPTRVNLVRRGVMLSLLLVRFVLLVRMIFSIFSFVVTLLGSSHVVYVGGGTWICTIGPLSRSGMTGSHRFVFLPRSNLYWRGYFPLLGGLFGGFGIAPFSRRTLLSVRRFSMI